MTPIKLRLLLLYLWLSAMAPTPQRDDGWTCTCGTWNESFRAACRNCGGS